MVVQRRDGPRRRREIDDDDDKVVTPEALKRLHTTQPITRGRTVASG